MTKTICIVEPLSSANYLAKRLKQEKYIIIALRVNNNNGMIGDFNIDSIRDSINYGLWDLVIDFDVQRDSIRALLIKLKVLKVEYLFYGCEYVVEFTDSLSQGLGLLHNDHYTANQRFDKFAMQMALAKCNLNIPRQALLTQHAAPAVVKNLINEVGFPMVLKPTNFFASMGVHVIHDAKEFSEFNLGEHLRLNPEVVCQEQIHGTGYLIDTFSLNGLHRISVIATYEKEVFGNNFLYRSINYVDPNTTIYHELCNYTMQVLDAVGVINGFAHSEIFVTPENGKFLIEVNPRISGAAGTVNQLAKICGGVDQIDLLNNALCNIELGKESTNQYGKIVLCFNFEPDKIFSSVDAQLFNSLDSYKSHVVTKQCGDALNVGGNLFDSFLYIILVNTDQNKLAEDYSKLIAYETQGALLH